MHELSICQSLIEQLDEIAINHPAARIAVVHLQVGPLSGVEPQLLSEAFPIASAGTAAQDALLEFHNSEIRVHCRKCGADTAALVNKLICGECGDWQTDLLSGDELMLSRVELETQMPDGSVIH